MKVGSEISEPFFEKVKYEKSLNDPIKLIPVSGNIKIDHQTGIYTDLYKINEAFLTRIIENKEEGSLWDFKLKLDISTHDTKAEFVRDMISLGNQALDERQKAFLIIGVALDEEKGYTITPNVKDDAIYQQIIRSYVDPSIKFEIRKPVILGSRIAIFVLLGVGTRPYSVRRRLRGPNNKTILNVGDSWVRFGSSKKNLSHEEFKELAERIARS
ncbi:MAG: hypothetical protein ACFFC7_24210 [Candidatus Hermodarchaeota archaeon]